VSSPSSIGDRLSSAQSLQSDNRRVEPITEPPLDPSLVSQTHPSYSPDSSNSSDGHGNRHSPAASVDLSSSSDEDTDPALDFYKLARSAGDKVCPFSASDRQNPCTTHDRPRVRKDAIMRHLKKVKRAGGDTEHPLNDPLWSSAIVNYWLNPRPERFDDRKRKAGSKSSAHRYYKKRKMIQETQADEKKTLYIEGKIAPDEYKKHLIGNKRREFIMEMNVKAQIEKDLREESERKLHVEIQQKLQELRMQDLGNDTTESNAATASILALEAAQNDIKEKQAAVDAYRDVLATQASNVVQTFADNDFLHAGLSFLEYHGFTWPSTVSAASFYTFTTMLAPCSTWDNQIRSPSSIRHMQRELHEYIQAEKGNVEGADDVAVLENIMATFNSCCDIIKAEESNLSRMTTDGAQRWLDEQSAMWEAARADYHGRFHFNVRSPLQLVRMVDQFADTWRAQKNAEMETQVAMQTATNQLP
jgi:hypothetical protein